MIHRVLAGLLVANAMLYAEDGPGVMLQGYASVIAMDMDGTVWGMHQAPEVQLVILSGTSWESRIVPGLDHEHCRPLSLASFADGDVGCLWQDLRESQDSWVLTRHRGGKSRVVSRFKANLEEPELLGVKDGRVFVTGACRTFVTIFPGDKEPQVVTLPERFFLPPERKQEDGTVGTLQMPVQAISDAFGTVWLWSPQYRWWKWWCWRLGGLVKVGPTPTDLKLCKIGEKGGSPTAFASWGESHLLVAMRDEGLFLLDRDGSNPKPMPAPDKDAFQDVAQLFHDGIAWHAITTPRPSEKDSTSSKQVHTISWSTMKFFDRGTPVGMLWRHEKGGWVLVHDGLDEDFCHEYSWLRTRAGLFLGGDEGVPWFFPADGGKPRHLDTPESFLLANVRGMLALDNERILLTDRSRSCLWPADAPLVKEKPSRWEWFSTTEQALQDLRGRIWCFLEDGKFVRRDGQSWVEAEPPPESLLQRPRRFVPDNRDRGWLFSEDDGPAAICNFATGKWQSFPTLRGALAAQLPQGVRLFIPECTIYEPVFSRDGRIGAVVGDGRILLFENGSWREWRFHEIAESGYKIDSAPFFDSDGHFGLPVGWTWAWRWFGEKEGWQLGKNDDNYYNRGYRERREDAALVPPEPGLEFECLTSAPWDRFGTLWQLDENKQLVHSALGQQVDVFSAGESNPFRHIESIHRALVDEAGNVFLDTTRGDDVHKHVLLHPRSPAPATKAHLARNEEDSAVVSLDDNANPPLWHTWRVDGGSWQPLTRKRELPINSLLPGKHTVEVRAFNAELTASPGSVALSFVTSPAADARFVASLRALAASDLAAREAAARTLRSQGAAVLPKLQAARQSASPDVQWWLDAIIQHIERQSAQTRK